MLPVASHLAAGISVQSQMFQSLQHAKVFDLTPSDELVAMQQQKLEFV
jgi:hypothetical protein